MVRKQIRIGMWGLAATFGLVSAAWAWDERGHVIVTRLAVGALPADMPAWVKTPATMQRLSYLCNEPDRWRGLNATALDHWNKPDHYIDVEMLPPFGLSLKTLPKYRYEFVAHLATERALHPDRLPAVAPDEDHVNLTPGMLPYRMIELYEEARSGWSTLRTLEADPANTPPYMIAECRERIVQSMGLLSHYVGDAAQPLHTTEHHHGWVGENPGGYTKDTKFHSYIDGGALQLHEITTAALWSRKRGPIDISRDAVWEAVLDHIDRSHRLVEPLYKLEKSGELKQPAGREFIEERLLDGGAMLSGLYVAAYRNAVMDDYLAKWLKRAETRDVMPAASQPTSSPAR